MTASRRQFTFGALMLAISGKARAGSDPELQQQVQAARRVELALAPEFAVRRAMELASCVLTLQTTKPASESASHGDPSS